MLYLDCSEYLKRYGFSMEDLLLAGASVGVIWQDGRDFGMDNTIRMNLAAPHSQIVEALERLKKYVFN